MSSPAAAAQADPSAPVNLIATIAVPSTRVAQVLGMLEEYGQTVRAEPGNQRFEVYSSQAESHSVVVVERYASQAAFKAHLANPANARFNGRLGDLLGGLESSLEFLHGSVPPPTASSVSHQAG